MSVMDFVRHAKFKIKHYFSAMREGNFALIVVVVIFVVCVYQCVVSMSRNWTLSETLANEKRKLEILQLDVDTMTMENKYHASDEYQELMARKLLDKKLPGENMVVMPENSEAAKTKHQTTEVVEDEQEKSNFEQWMMYLFPDK